LIRIRPVNSLLGKAAIPTALVVAVIAGIFSAAQIRATDRQKTESLQGYATLLGRLVLNNLRDAMITNERDRLQSLLIRLTEIEPIVQVRIVSKVG